MQSPPFPRYLVPPRSKYSPQHHILKHPQLPFLSQCLEGQIIESILTIVPAGILVFIAIPSLRLLYLIYEIHNPVMFLYPSFFPSTFLTVRYSVSFLFCLSFHTYHLRHYINISVKCYGWELSDISFYLPFATPSAFPLLRLLLLFIALGATRQFRRAEIFKLVSPFPWGTSHDSLLLSIICLC